MNKAQISENFVMPSFQTVNKNPQSTELILMDPQNGHLYLLHQYYCTNSQDYGDLIALLQTQASHDSQCPYVLNPVVYLPIRYTNPQFQTSHFVQVLYQYGSHTLQQQLYLRIQEKNYFEEHQIWSIMGSCILGLKSLKDKQFIHSSICMNDIFVTKQGQIKLCHPMFRTYDHYAQTIDEQYIEKFLCDNYFFSPEQLSNRMGLDESSLIINQNPTTDDFFKCDIFTLGMNILTLCSLRSLSDCYVKKATKNNQIKLTIDSKRLEEYFFFMQQTYSQDLISLLCSMLSYQPHDRISIDQLAIIIEEMINAKSLNESFSEYFEQNVPQSFSNSDQKISSTSKQANQQLESMNYSKFGKFSRVSQASPISGRKTNRSYQQGLRMHLLPSDTDQQDRPSPASFPSANDIQQTDKSQKQEQNIQEINNSIIMQQPSIPQIQQKSPSIKSSLSNQNKSIDQTLKQYINQQSQSSVSEVNQTKTYEQYNKKEEAKNAQQPKQIVSVMTSKELSSLPSESISFVDDKHHENSRLNDKQNQMNLNNLTSHYATSDTKENYGKQTAYNLNLNEFNFDKQKLHPLSARTYVNSDFTKKSHDSFVDKYKGENYEQNMYQINRTKQNQLRNSLTISLNKDYDQLIQAQHNNPNSIYTEPRFLQAIRSDINKILTKRGIKLINQTESISERKQPESKKGIFINGKKVNQNSFQQFSIHNEQRINSMDQSKSFYYR